MESYSKKKTAVKAVKYPAIVLAVSGVAVSLATSFGWSSEVVTSLGILVPVVFMAIYDALKHKFGWKLP